MKRTMLAAASLLLLGADAAPAPLTLHLVIDGLRSSKGELRVCVWHDGFHFPDCKRGREVLMLSAPAAPTVRLDIGSIQPGSYAVSVIHDENANRQLDKNLVGIPTEGVGFSRNPRIMFGPPSFKAARFDLVTSGEQQIRLKYFL